MASVEKQPRKGILKTSSSFDKVEANRGKEMKWDEMNIIATHHPPGKDYGHMKIDEPPTPYSKNSDVEDDDEGCVERRGSFGKKDDMDPSSLSSRLEGIEGPRLRRVSTEDEDSSEEEEELTDEQRAIKEKFEQKRKLHYNEFQAVKLAKQLMEEEDEDEEEDDNNDMQNIDKMQTDQSDAQNIHTDGNSGSSTSGSRSAVGLSEADLTPEGVVREARETLID